MGSFPSHSSQHHHNQQGGYIQPVNSRTPGFLYSQTSRGSMGSIKNIPLIETTPTHDNPPETRNTNLQLKPSTNQQDEGKLAPHQKTSLDTSRSRTSRSGKDVSSQHVVDEISSQESSQDSDCSSSSQENSFQLFPGFTLGTNSRYSPHISSSPCLPLPHIGSLPISFRPTEIEFSKKNKRSFSLDERSDEQTRQDRQLHSSTISRRKMSVVPSSDNNNLLPPDLSITVSTPEESNKKPSKITLEIPTIETQPTEKGDSDNLSEFKMGSKPSQKKVQIADVPDFANYQLGQKPPKQKKVGFMGPLVDIIVHGGLGLPNNHKVRRHSYTPVPSADLMEKSKVSPRKPITNANTPQMGLIPSQSEKRDLSKSVADFVLPQPVDIEPSPKLFVATISKTRRMSLKDETAERLNDLLSKQRTDQYKL